jgi:glutamate-1-semialdehyde 2,1-aminomutase
MTFEKSDTWLRRGEQVDAWAATRGSIRELDAANVLYPQYVSRAEGGHIWDVDGNRYVDFVLGYGPVILGHADKRVNAAVADAISRGVCISPMWSPSQVELAELLIQVIPGAERAFLLKTGSDATAAAVRLARIFTGREKVLKWGYNGWHDWTAPRPAGVPRAVQENTLHFTYNDLASVEKAFAEQPDQIACVIMMPFELEIPEEGFLVAVKEVAHRNGALFVLDEMRSGFRVALGGAQEFFGIVADLATFSKAMANGFPISALVGRADILSGLASTHMTSTFFANPPEMAASLATITILRDTDALEIVHHHAEHFFNGLQALIEHYQAPAVLRGYPVSPFLEFVERDGTRAADVKVAFYRETLKRGVLFHPNHQWFFCAAHTEEDIESTLAACAAAFERALNGHPTASGS